MCGIIGYVGSRNVVPVLIDGLKKLEYRGYDSAGIAVYDGNNLQVRKAKGRISVLEERILNEEIPGTIGIGHTRWATHGEPSDINSHPQTNLSGSIAVVHNGIIENYIKLKKWLKEKGYVFVSETDTEVIAHLINYYYNGNLVDAVIKTLDKIKGSYALGVICEKNPDEIVAVKKDSPLVVGLGDGENFIASDIPAILEYTKDVYLLEDNEIAVIKRNTVKILNEDHEKIEKEVFHIDWDISSAEKGGYKHFMMKEIHEEPDVLNATLNPRLTDDGKKISINEINMTNDEIKNLDKIFIVACGSAAHTAFVGKNIIENLTGIPVEVDLASEFRYRNPIFKKNQIVVVISQSGETADTIAALREAKKNGVHVLAVVNVVGSTISREADDVFYIWAGPEIAVATTKAFSAQLMALYILALDMAKRRNTITDQKYDEIIKALKNIPSQINTMLNNESVLQKYANKHFNAKNIFFIGRGLDYSIAMEGSLKLKEISYIHSEAYAAGELKHGTIALIEEGTLVIALVTQEHLFDKMLGNIREVKTRGAEIMAVAMEGMTEIEKAADYVVYIPRTLEITAPILAVTPLQLFAYYMAIEKGCDVDKPRNLAKSVTVE